MTTEVINKVRSKGFLALTIFALMPTMDGYLGKVQKVLRVPVNLAIVSFFVPLFLLFTSLWQLGLVAFIAWWFFVPKAIKTLRDKVAGV